MLPASTASISTTPRDAPTTRATLARDALVASVATRAAESDARAARRAALEAAMVGAASDADRLALLARSAASKRARAAAA